MALSSIEEIEGKYEDNARVLSTHTPSLTRKLTKKIKSYSRKRHRSNLKSYSVNRTGRGRSNLRNRPDWDSSVSIKELENKFNGLKTIQFSEFSSLKQSESRVLIQSHKQFPSLPKLTNRKLDTNKEFREKYLLGK